MRIYLKLSKSHELVPFEHSSTLTGILNKWINDVKIHDSLSLYSFSGLKGGVANKIGIDFPQGGEWFISAYDQQLIAKIIRQIKLDPHFLYGMKVKEVIICDEPRFSEKERFLLATPIFIKRTVDKKSVHYLYTDDKSDELMTETMQTKLKKAGLSDDSCEITFDRSYQKSKIKLVSYKSIKNKVNWCPIIIKAKPETIQFAWDVGVGNSTGIGFGAIL